MTTISDSFGMFLSVSRNFSVVKAAIDPQGQPKRIDQARSNRPGRQPTRWLLSGMPESRAESESRTVPLCGQPGLLCLQQVVV